MGNCSSDVKGQGIRLVPSKKGTNGRRGGSTMNTRFTPNTAPKVEEHLFAMCMRMGPMKEVETYCNDGKIAFEAALTSKPGSLECKSHLDAAMVSLKKARDVEERSGEPTLNLGITYLHLGHIYMFFNDKANAKASYEKGQEVMAALDRTLDGYQLLRTFSKEKMTKKVSISKTEPEIIGRVSPRTPVSL